MTVQIHSNALKHKRDFNFEEWKHVKKFMIEHQKHNGDWLILIFDQGTDEYNDFKSQNGTLYIQFNITADIIAIKN